MSPGEEVLEGQEVTVTCSSDGPPLPSLLLRSEGAGILRSGPAPISVTLLLNGSTHFYCLASNPLGAQQVSRAVRVTGMTSLPVSSRPASSQVRLLSEGSSSLPPSLFLSQSSEGVSKPRPPSAPGLPAGPHLQGLRVFPPPDTHLEEAGPEPDPAPGGTARGTRRTRTRRTRSTWRTR